MSIKVVSRAICHFWINCPFKSDHLCCDLTGCVKLLYNMKMMLPTGAGASGLPRLFSSSSLIRTSPMIDSLMRALFGQGSTQQKRIKMLINCGWKTMAWWEGEEETDRERGRWCQSRTGGFVLANARAFVYLMPPCEKEHQQIKQEPWWLMNLD